MSSKKAVYSITEFKAVNGSPGEFVALVSAFNNVDKQGDRVVKGAFAKSLARWKQSGDSIPVIWNHEWDNPFAHIGVVTDARETDRGLQITGKNDIEKPFAAQVHDLMTSRRVKGMSFAYEVIDERRAKDGANELLELDILEAGPTLVGANPEAQLLLAKAAEQETAQTKAGRRLSSATRNRLQAMRDELDALLAEDDEDPKNAPAEDAGTPELDTSDQEPPSAKSADETETPDIDQEPPSAKSRSVLLELQSRIETERAYAGARH